MSEPLLELDELACGYGGDPVLRDVTLSVAAGEMLGVLGANGAGKSTLLRAANGAARLSAGRVRLAGRALGAMTPREVARVVAVLPQETAPAFPATVLETVLLGRLPWRSPLAFDTGEDVAAADAALDAVGALALRDREIGALSGGERQRVHLARALCQGGEVLLCDEPTAHLDLRHQDEVFALLAAQRDAGRAVVVVTHDLGAAARVCDRVALLAGGTLLAAGRAAEVLTPPHTLAAFGVELTVRREGGALHVVRTSPPAGVSQGRKER